MSSNPDESYCRTNPSEPPAARWFGKAGRERGHDTCLQPPGAPAAECGQVSFTP